MSKVDFLLLNVSNYPSNPIFPYAFVQVSALARKNKLTTTRLDLYGSATATWKEKIQQAIQKTKPRMIGITLRQVDSLIEGDYLTNAKKYLPAKETRILIEMIRSTTSTPIVVGGFGFTTYAEELVTYLQPDFGVRGEPDDFLEKFEKILLGLQLDDVQNLIYRDPNGLYQFNKRRNYGPFQETEYTDEIANELIAFYGDLKPICVPIEVMRGCPMRCYFCSEPAVKGLRLNKRDLDVVMKDVEFMAVNKGIRNFWFVASELNVAGPALALEIARRMIAFRDQSQIKDIQWFGYLLPKIKDPTIIKLLADSGHCWSWNEVQSLCDKNLKETKVPYKVDEALIFYTEVMKERLLRTGEKASLSFFMGNAFSTPSTIITTLTRIEDENLHGKIGRSAFISGTRIFPSRIDSLPKDHGPFTRYSAEDRRVGAKSLLRPTYYLPPQISEVLGGPVETMRFFYYLSGTFVTHDLVGRNSEELLKLLKKFIKPQKIGRMLSEVSSARLEDIPQSISDDTRNALKPYLQQSKKNFSMKKRYGLFAKLLGAKNNDPFYRELAFSISWLILITMLSSKWKAISIFLFESERINLKMFGSFNLAQKLLARYQTQRQLLNDLRKNFDIVPHSPEYMAVRLFLTLNNIKFRPQYQKFFTTPTVR